MMKKIVKKLLLCVALGTFAFTANAQDGAFSVEANVGFPVGDAGNFSSFVLGAQVNYMFSSEEDFKWGASAGFSNYFGKKGAPSSSILPLAAVGRYNASEEFVVGADLGYALGLSNISGGGLYYRPMVGYNVNETMQITASYAGMSVSGGSIANFGVGLKYAF